MYKIAVLGDMDSVLGFSALGLDVFPTEGGDAAVRKLRELARGGKYAIIYVTETYYEELKNEMDRYKDSVIPAIIIIPGADGASGIGKKAIDEAVERAIGANII